MAKTKDASTPIISGSRNHTTVHKKALDGRQYPGVGGRKRKRFNANRYKSLFVPQRIRIESDDKGVPEGQDNSPQDNASTNFNHEDKELKVQNSIRVQEAHDEAKKAVLDQRLMDVDQVESTENGNLEKQIGGECSPSNRNADYDACADNDNHIFHTSSSRNDIENQPELDPCDKVTGTCKAAGVTENAVNNDAATNVQNYGNISNSSKFVEFWVPVQLSNVQLEQYCATLLSNEMVLRCGSKDTVDGALQDIFISNRKCCNHPYVVDPTLHSKILKDQEPTMLKLDADIKASGKLQFLDLILPEVKKRQLRVLILFQSTTVTTKGIPSVGEMLFDFVHQRFGEDSYECVLTGLQPATRQTALNKFNKDMSIPFFLLEHRACHANIKLSSVDIIVIYDSDLTPTNDLKSLQKISIDSQSEQIMIFRLYTSSTLEEKILKPAESNDSKLHNVRSRYDALLKWGASDLFDRLTEFHRGSVFSISSEESFLKDVVEEFFYLISNKSESNDKSNSIITRVQNFGIYGKNSETRTHLPDGDQPHIFWKKLLEGRHPIWKFVSFLTPRQRKRPHYLDGMTKRTNTEDGDGVKIRRKTVKPVIEEETGHVNEGGSGIAAHKGPQSSLVNRFQSTAVGNEKSLQDLLKAIMSELSNVLNLSDDVKITVEKFLEFVLENFCMSSSEHTSTLQALMISMCWIGSALQNIKIDRLESFAIAKKHLNFICQLEEAYSVYGKLQSAKEAFVQQTDRPVASKECFSSPQRAKFDTERSQHTKSYREEINKFYREWEEQRVNLEKNYRMDQARIRSMHSNLSVRSEKMTQLKVNFVNKLEKHGKLREVYLKELKARQLTAKDGHPLHGPRDNIPEVGPSHDEPVDHIPTATEGDGVYDVELTGSHTSEKQMTDAMVSSGPIGEVSTQHYDDIKNDVAREVDSPAVERRNEAGSNDDVSHGESPKIGMPAGNCNKDKAADGGELRKDLCGSSSNLPSADVSPEVTIPENENESLQVQQRPPSENQDKEPNSLVEVDVEYRSFLDADQLGQIILEASSLDPHDEPPLIAENQSDVRLSQSEILLESISEQIPEAPIPQVTAEFQNPNTPSLALDMIDNVNHVGPLTPNHANPLQAEEERLRVAMDDVIKLHEETKERLKSDCEKEVAKMAAQISLKYEAKCQEEEAAFHLKKKEIDANVKRAVMNKILAAAFRSKCQDLTLSGNAGKQQGSQTGLMQQLNSLSGSFHLRRSLNNASISSCQSSGSHQTTSPPPTLSTLLSSSPPPPTPLALQSQLPLQIVHQPADLFSSQSPPSTNRPTVPSTTSTTSRPPPVINPITPSTTANSLSAANQRVNNETLGQASRIRPPVANGEVRPPAPHMRTLPRSDIRSPAPHLRSRAPAPHIRPFRPTSSIPPDFANQPRMLPAQHATSTPLTSPSNSQSPVLPPLPTSSTPPLQPLPPEPNVVPPPPLSSGSSPQPLSQLPPKSNTVPPPPLSSESSLQPLPQLLPEPNVVPPPPLSSESSLQPLPPLPPEPCVVAPIPSGSSPQPLPPLPSEPYFEPPPAPPPPPPPGSSPHLLPPLPIEPYAVPPPPPSPPPSSISATSSPLPNTSSDTTSPQVTSIPTPTSGGPSLTLTDNLNELLNDNAAHLGNILPTTPDLVTHSTGPEFICLLDDD